MHSQDFAISKVVNESFNVTILLCWYQFFDWIDRFIVEVVAKETASPERFATTKVHVSCINCYCFYREQKKNTKTLIDCIL